MTRPGKEDLPEKPVWKARKAKPGPSEENLIAELQEIGKVQAELSEAQARLDAVKDRRNALIVSLRLDHAMSLKDIGEIAGIGDDACGLIVKKNAPLAARFRVDTPKNKK